MTAKRPRRPRDPNQLAHTIIGIATGAIVDSGVAEDDPNKDPLAVELGRRGGLKGGRARADKLSAEKRSEIAKRAAKTRWARK
jgi:hypothetical protein